MKTTATLETIIDRVHEVSANHYDEVIPVQDMEFDSLNQVWISGRRADILPSAQTLLANRLRVPLSYLSRCPAELQARNLNYWIEQEQKNRDTFFCRFAGDSLRAVFTDRYVPTDNLSTLSKMLEFGFDPRTEVQFMMDAEMMVLKVPDYDRTFRLFDKDKIVPGISISNSEVGIIALSIEAFYYRLVCTNGMIVTTAVDESRYKHISSKAMDKFHSILEQVVSRSRNGQARFMISIQTPVDNPERTIDAFTRQFHISKEETEIVKKAFCLEEGATMFHIINAFTRAAQDKSLSALDSYRLEKAGGAILGMVKS